MDRDDKITILIAGSVTVFLIGLLIWAIHGIWWDTHGKPTVDYCKETVPIIYVNQTALTDNDRCLDYLISEDYQLLGKNGSYYILEPKK